MLCFALTALLALGTAASPMLRSLEQMNSPCLSKCVADVDDNTALEIDFGKTTNYGQQLANLEDTCASMTKARDCVAKCNLPLNPFDMKAMKAMCSDKRRAELKQHAPCYSEQGNATVERCDNMCGSMDTQGTVLSANNTDFDFSVVLDQMGEMCTLSKCHARCSRDTFAELCHNTDPEAGAFLQTFTEDILKAANEDLNQFGMKSLMKGMMPKQCHFIFYPGQLFNESDTESESDTNEEDPELNALFADMFKSLSAPPPEEHRRKESRLAQMEMRVLDKQERNLDKEMEKLDLEMKILNKKLML